MRAFRVLTTIAILLLMTGVVKADGSGSWDLVNLNFNTDNRFMSGSAYGDKMVIAFGMEKDQQGSTAPVLKRSMNSGESLTAVSPVNYGGMLFLYTDMQMLSEDVGIAVGMEVGMSASGYTAGPIWKISSKGGVVDQQVAVMGEFPVCERVYCININKCWVSCEKGLMLRTDNFNDPDSSKVIWHKSNLPVTDLNSPGPVFFLNDQVGFVAMGASNTENESTTVLTKGTIFKTTNGGQNWTAISEGRKETYSAMWWLDDQNGFIGSTNGWEYYLLRTTDGGANWNGVNVESKGNLAHVGAIQFLNQNVGWIVASYGTVQQTDQNAAYFYRTEDGGNNWTTFTPMNDTGSPLAGQIWDMVMINEHLGYGFGEFQSIVKFSDGTDPVEDGDTDPVDGDSVVDGDGTEPDGDVDTGPVYDGMPGEPCPVMDDASTWDIPRCNIEHGSDLCLWKDDVDPYCTSFCEVDNDCKKFGPDACCKPVSFEGKSAADSGKRVCFLTNTFCADYSGMWKGYNGALPGEACKTDGFEDNPQRDENYGGEFCIDEQRGGDTFVSSFCTTDEDCASGFQTEYCCNGEYGEQKYCRYSNNCDPDWDPSIDGDFSLDGDVAEDGDVPDITDGDDGGSDQEGSSGCSGVAGSSAMLFALSMLAIVRRRRD